MRSKFALAALFILSVLPVRAQVSPAAKLSGLPLSVGFSLSDYSLDYGPGRRMIGLTANAEYRVFHGLGIEAEGTSIFAAKPDSLTRMRQDTIKGGAVFKYHPVYHIRPFAKGMIGLGSIDFPSHNPLYTHDTFTVFAMGGGAEYRIWKTFFVRGEYEYQIWRHYQGKSHSLTPNGVNIGVEYYLRGLHQHN